MKFHVENLGKIQSANIKIRDLTIICGPNSSNKTWLSYLIGSVLDTLYIDSSLSQHSKIFESFVNEAIDNGSASIKSEEAFNEFLNAMHSIIEESKTQIHKFFNVEKSVLSNMSFHFDMSVFKDTPVEFQSEWVPSEEYSKLITQNGLITLEAKSIADIDISQNEYKYQLSSQLTTFLSLNYSQFKIQKPYLVSSERTGALLLQPDVDRASIAINELIKSAEKLDLNQADKRNFIKEMIEAIYDTKSRISIPVSNNIKDVRNAQEIMESTGEVAVKNPEIIALLDELNGGTFEFNNGDITYLEQSVTNRIKIGSTSSSIKALFLIDLYIRHQLDPNDILLIDEPELNLHPDNQRLMAKLLVRLANAGVTVIITTHSDFLVREINNSISLSTDFEGKDEFLKEHGLTTLDTILPENVSAYSVDKEGHVSEMETGSYGIETDIFDELINKSNNLQDEILYKLDPSLYE